MKITVPANQLPPDSLQPLIMHSDKVCEGHEEVDRNDGFISLL